MPIQRVLCRLFVNCTLSISAHVLCISSPVVHVYQVQVTAAQTAVKEAQEAPDQSTAVDLESHPPKSPTP